MKTNKDLKKEWENAKKQLNKISQEAVELAKKGEKEFIKFSERSILHMDSTAVSLKKEKLYYQIGKEYVSLEDPAVPSPTLIKYVDEIKKLERQQKNIQRKLKPEKKQKKSL